MFDDLKGRTVEYKGRRWIVNSDESPTPYLLLLPLKKNGTGDRRKIYTTVAIRSSVRLIEEAKTDA